MQSFEATEKNSSVRPWHIYETEELLRLLGSSATHGLSQEEVDKKTAQYGSNELPTKQELSWVRILLNQCKNILTIILLFASIVSGVLGHTTEAVAIAIIVFFAIILGFVQEFRAERAIDALKRMAAPTALVLRGGVEQEIPANQVVPGDIIIVATGDRIPADARVIDSINIKTDEASLTGESLPVEKKAVAINDESKPLAERSNMLYSSTNLTYGRGRALVVAIGLQTEMGKIAGLLENIESQVTPLQKNLDALGKRIGQGALLIVVMIVLVGLVKGQPILDLFIFGIALAVAVVPEALPAVVTISLAIGVQRMVKRHALIRRLPAVETLGSTTVICTDKTGTLTKDEMTVKEIYLPEGIWCEVSGSGYEPKGEILLQSNVLAEHSVLQELLKAGVLSSDAQLIEAEGRFEIKGDPTEGALVVLAAKRGLNKELIDETCPRIAEIPFTSETKRMTTFHTCGDTTTAYSKGAPEVMLAACSSYATKDGERTLDNTQCEEFLKKAQEMASKALRVLALAYKPKTTYEQAEQGMIFLGLVGMIDPARVEALPAIQKCQEAGIRLIMITGDHPVTAEAIARDLGILRPTGRVITGVEFDNLSDEAFLKEIKNIDVFARVSPTHKLRVITALQTLGEIVAMTGDGVNDAPALKKADIGIAMGITGTDVTKEAAAMNLTDDNFASIVAAVEEGRIMFGNIKKYLMYLLSSNIGEIGIMVGASLLGLPLPLTAVQILYVNLATDGLPALALALDPPDSEVMKHRPRKVDASIFSKPVIILMITGGMWSAIVNISLFAWSRNAGRSIAEASAMVFVTLVLVEFFKAYSFRSDKLSIFHKPFANGWLNKAIVWELLLLSLVLYVPLLQRALGTFSFKFFDWAIVLATAITVIPVLEVTKRMLKKYSKD